MPPLARFDEHLNDEQHALLHSGTVQHLVDGQLVPIRASAVLVWHECDPEVVPPDTEVLTIGDRQLDALIEERAARLLQDRLEAQAYVQALHARPDIRQQQEEEERALRLATLYDEKADQREERRERGAERREKRKRKAATARQEAQKARDVRAQWEHNARESAHEKHGDIASVTCPFCGATPGALCLRKGTTPAGHRGNFVTNPHPERRDWAHGSGMVDGRPISTPQRDSAIKDWVDGHRKASRTQLREWLLANREFWSEIGTTGDDVNLFGNPDDASVEAGSEN